MAECFNTLDACSRIFSSEVLCPCSNVSIAERASNHAIATDASWKLDVWGRTRRTVGDSAA